MVLQALPGDVFGLYFLFAGDDFQTQAWRLLTASACSILWIEREEFFDLLSQRSDLLQQVFAAREGRPAAADDAATDDRTSGRRDDAAAGLDEGR